MKAFICVKNDWDWGVIDVFLIFEIDGVKIERDIKGFDDFEWKKANEFAEKLAKLLSIEFVGDRTDT